MFLKRLEIHGFKSFAKKTVLDFEPGITSVVGPNGSGKSNLADALRWVFGEQSMKTLRGKKSEDVIFAGTDKKARMGAAEVSVTFDNADQAMPIEYHEVVIGRRLFRDGTSEYLINGNQVRLLDIHDLLSRSGFGNSSYHVVGQGMIDQLVLGGPASIKDAIEDAAGVKPYYMKRDRALRRLERTQSNLEQVHALIKEIEPRLKSLRRQAKKLEQRADVEAALKEAYALYYGQQIVGLDAQLQETDEQIKSFDTQIRELESEIEKLSKDIDAQESSSEGVSDEFQKTRKELEELRKVKQKTLEEQAMLRGALTVQEQSNVPVHIDFDVLKKKLERIYAVVKQVSELLTQGSAHTDAVTSQIQETKKQFEELFGELDRDAKEQQRSEKVKEIETRLSTLDQEVKKLNEQVEGVEKKLEEFMEHEDETKKQLFVKERLLRTKQDNLLKTRDQKNTLSVEQARITTRKENFEKEAREALGHDFQTIIAMHKGATVPAGISEKIAKLKKELEIIGGVDDLTMQEYSETEERYSYLSNQSQDLEKAMNDLKKAIAELDERIKKDFNTAFQKIADKFSEYFRILFGGGKATMSIVREQVQTEEGEEEPTDEVSKKPSTDVAGVVIRATPPGKKLAGLAALSGGERALTSIAFLCSLLSSFPSPFVVLDEVDAALDEANSIRFGKILGTLADNTQFITITHNRETMRQSHTLYGVTMDEHGVSRILSLKLEQAAAYSSKN